jgi:hypothetical protein
MSLTPLERRQTCCQLTMAVHEVVKTTEASPRGPNQPMNARVIGRRCVPMSAIATGTILIAVRLSIA